MKAMLKTYELFIYGGIYYFTNSFCKIKLKIATLQTMLWTAFFIISYY